MPATPIENPRLPFGDVQQHRQHPLSVGPARQLNCGFDTDTAIAILLPFISSRTATWFRRPARARASVPNGQFIGGNGEGFVDGHQIQITPQLDRYNINVIGAL